MHESYEFLRNLAVVLCVAATTTVIFQKLKQPVVFGYLLAGMIVGPYLPIPLVVDMGMVQTLSQLGVILLMFGLGLEFSFKRLIQVGSSSGLIAVLESSAMVWMGYLIARAFGWSQIESVYAGAAIGISSTTIIVKAFAEQGAKGRFTDVVFGILIIEDIIAILLLTILTAVSSGGGVSAATIGITTIRLIVFLASLIGFGLFLIPRFMRLVVKLDRPETTLVASIGICFAAAILALVFGYSVALGAFIAGSLIAESGEEKKVAPLIAPVRDMFAAIFFVSVGMMINPAIIAEYWVPVVILVLAVMVGKVVFVSIGAFLSGYSIRTSVQSGMSLSQIGEFSLIITSVGMVSGATRPFLYPIAIAVSAITTLTTPWLIRASGPVAAIIDRRLPKPVQTFVSLYGSWIERMRSTPEDAPVKSRTRRLVRLILLDAVLIAAIIIGTTLEAERIIEIVTESTELSAHVVLAGVYVLAAAVAIPLLVGLLRSANMLGARLAARALPNVESGKLDMAAAPRRSFVVTLQLGILCIVGIPIVAITQPFLPPLRSGAIVFFVLALLGIAFWRSASNLHGHARAGAQVIVAMLADQMASKNGKTHRGLDSVEKTLPGLGEPLCIDVGPDSPVVGKTLAQINLRGLTGATILAIDRGADQVLLPIGKEVLQVGDVLAVAGTRESVDAAKEVLQGV